MNHPHDKLIFLDFDGVLNTVGTKVRIKHPIFDMKIRGLEDTRVKLVSDLANEFNAKIVISSSWREFISLENIKKMLSELGMTAEIIGETPQAFEDIGFGFNKMRLGRSEEIEAYLFKNGYPKNFLIIDDLQTKFFNNQILTSDSTGFFRGHLVKARRILSSEMEVPYE